jgi:2-hydroxy-6-oxonona-2,4-dienedioate hydrolase
MGRRAVLEPLLRSVWNDVDGVVVHARVSVREFPRERTPIVFVHGLGASARYMEPTMRVLAREHPVAALDFPGFGRSDNPRRTFGRNESFRYTLSLRELSHTLARWLDVLQLPPGVLVGNSFGCQIIVDCVSHNAHCATGLVLNAPTMDPAHRTAFGQLIRVIADIPREPLSLAAIVARDYLRAGPIRLLKTLRSALADRIEEKLPRIAIPTMVVCGARDPVVTVEWADQVARLTGRDLPGATGGILKVLDHAAHALPYDDPEAFSALILELVARQGRDPARDR